MYSIFSVITVFFAWQHISNRIILLSFFSQHFLEIIPTGTQQNRNGEQSFLWRKRNCLQVEWTLFRKGNVDGLVMFWDTTDFCMKLLKAEWEVNQQEGGEEFKCFIIWQMMMICWTQMGSRGQRWMETQTKEDYWRWWARSLEDLQKNFWRLLV